MSDIGQSHYLHAGTEKVGVPHGHPPYWRRAHRDWRVWVGVIVMIACMVVYVMSEYLSLRPRSRPQQPVPGLLGR